MGKQIRTPEYVAWINMIQRCENPAVKHYRLYGGAGVVVCDRWRASFAAFFEDNGSRPTPGHSLDRYPDPNGNYEPGNTRWATDVEQARNRRDNRLITAFGKTQCIAAWSHETGVMPRTISMRLAAGDSSEEALRPTERATLLMFGGERIPIAEISKRTGIPINTFMRRMQRHGDADVAVECWRRNNKGKKNARHQSRAS